jgi:hypothetical protein
MHRRQASSRPAAVAHVTAERELVFFTEGALKLLKLLAFPTWAARIMRIALSPLKRPFRFAAVAELLQLPLRHR